MSVKKCFVLYCTVFCVIVIHIEMLPVTSDPQDIVLRLPKHFENGTNMTVIGNSFGNFSAILHSETDNEEFQCKILFDPSKSTIVVKDKTSDVPHDYDFDITSSSTLVNFKLQMTARDSFDQHSYVNLHFTSNNGGPWPLGDCEVSYENLEYLVFKGVQHVQRLIINFKDI